MRKIYQYLSAVPALLMVLAGCDDVVSTAPDDEGIEAALIAEQVDRFLAEYDLEPVEPDIKELIDNALASPGALDPYVDYESDFYRYTMTLLRLGNRHFAPRASLFYPGYHLVRIRSEQADTQMPVPGPTSGIPERLQGLWWMDGNPNAAELVSMGRSVWNPASRSIAINLYDEAIWSWHDSIPGRFLNAEALAFRLTYKVVFDTAMTFGKIYPVVSILGRRVQLPRYLVRFDMRFIEDGLWMRDSAFFGIRVNTYRFRRVVSPTGEREEGYAEYVQLAPPWSLLGKKN